MRETHPLIRIGGPILGALILYYVISTMVNQFQTDLDAMRRAGAAVEDVVVMEPETAADTEEAASAEEGGAAAAEGAATTEQAAEAGPEAGQPEPGDTEGAAGAPPETEPAGDEATAETPVEPDAAAEAAPETTEPETAEPETTQTETAAPEDAATPATQPEDEAAGQASAEAAPAETEEPAVTQSEAEAATDPIYAGLPDEIAAFFPDEADPEQGQQLSVSTGCTACHSLQEGVVQVGPSWYNVAGHAASRVEGQSPALYLYTSIVDPNVYVNEGFLPNLMPQNYPDILSDEQIAHIIAYLLTLHGEE